MADDLREMAEKIAHDFYWCLPDPGLEKQLARAIETALRAAHRKAIEATELIVLRKRDRMRRLEMIGDVAEVLDDVADAIRDLLPPTPKGGER